VQGNRSRIRLRMDATYMKLAAQGGL
jgi:hypothetical protein